MAVNEATIGRAYDSARLGMQTAQARVERAAASLSRVAPDVRQGPAAAAQYAYEQRNAIGDVVELSRAGVEMQANAASFRAAGDVFNELMQLGQRVDRRV
jgi:hypothetical protein